MRTRAIFSTAAVVLAGAVSLSAGVQVGPGRAMGEAQPTPAPAPKTPELVPAVKLRKAVDGWREARAEISAMRVQLRQADHLVGLINRPTPEGNREIARRYFGSEYSCAAFIIGHETGGTWRHDVAYGFRYGEHLINANIAYGLGQALPGTKMLRFGADAASNPLTQLIWFRSYAEARYGSVCAASAHWARNRAW